MDPKFTIIFILVLSMTYATNRIRNKRTEAAEDVAKSGVSMTFTTDSKDQKYVTCAAPFLCCSGALGWMSTIISDKCLRDDGFPGVCCKSKKVTLAEVTFQNGTTAGVWLNEDPVILEPKFVGIAESIEKNQKDREASTNTSN